MRHPKWEGEAYYWAIIIVLIMFAFKGMFALLTYFFG